METRIESITTHDQWAGLISRVPDFIMCQTPEYAGLALEMARERGERAELITATQNGKLVGLWPMTTMRQKGKLITRPAGCSSYEEYGAPLIDPACAVEARRAVLDQAFRMPTDLLYINNIPKTDPITAILCEPRFAQAAGMIAHPVTRYLIGLSKYQTRKDYLDNTSGSHRKGLRNAMRRLQDLGKVEIRACSTPQEVHDVLRHGYELKRLWLKKNHERSPPWMLKDNVLEFFGRFSSRVDLEKTALVTALWLDGRPIAIQHNQVGSKVFEYCFTVYDDRYAKFSPGQMLLEHYIEWAQEHGLDYDFRWGPEAYKKKVADLKEELVTHQIMLTPKARLLFPMEYHGRRLVMRGQRVIWRVLEKVGYRN